MPKEQGSEAKEFTELAEHKGLYESNFTQSVNQLGLYVKIMQVNSVPILTLTLITLFSDLSKI